MELTTISGKVTHQSGYEIIEWVCPYSGILVNSVGEHYYDEDLGGYIHDVYEEDTLNILYSVIGK